MSRFFYEIRYTAGSVRRTSEEFISVIYCRPPTTDYQPDQRAT